MRARSLLLGTVVLVATAGVAVVVVACKQILGVQDLGVVDAGSTAPGNPCHTLGTTEDCYSCCAVLDGGDPGFFRGDLHDCVCQSECSADCPLYCGPTAPGDSVDCDLCIYLSAIGPEDQCQQRAATAGTSTPGAMVIYQCLTGCQPPSDTECASVTTLRGCYDCCEGKHPAAPNVLFGATAQACVCDAGCAATCPDYCPNAGADDGLCTQCALDSLVDGGCAATGAGLCVSQDCMEMTACMQRCAQTQ